MSLGVKRKPAVVTAFISDPDILILDEPTGGLDPVMQGVFDMDLSIEKGEMVGFAGANGSGKTTKQKSCRRGGADCRTGGRGFVSYVLSTSTKRRSVTFTQGGISGRFTICHVHLHCDHQDCQSLNRGRGNRSELAEVAA